MLISLYNHIFNNWHEFYLNLAGGDVVGDSVARKTVRQVGEVTSGRW